MNYQNLKAIFRLCLVLAGWGNPLSASASEGPFGTCYINLPVYNDVALVEPDNSIEPPFLLILQQTGPAWEEPVRGRKKAKQKFLVYRDTRVPLPFDFAPTFQISSFNPRSNLTQAPSMTDYLLKPKPDHDIDAQFRYKKEDIPRLGRKFDTAPKFLRLYPKMVARTTEEIVDSDNVAFQAAAPVKRPNEEGKIVLQTTPYFTTDNQSYYKLEIGKRFNDPFRTLIFEKSENRAHQFKCGFRYDKYREEDDKGKGKSDGKDEEADEDEEAE
ncbi:MAG: hypothetical protein JNM39_04685 [Bdellovibrionaceae bacterium]|nr:hypothetical protein [Pseudobdellovibrionaceae bacterium]